MRAVKFLVVGALFGLAACGPKVTAIELSPSAIALSKKGESAMLVATAKDATGKKVEEITLAFETGDPRIATVDAAGKVTAVDTGETKIAVTFDKVRAAVPVTVTIPASISVAPTTVKLERIGARAVIVAHVLDKTGKEIKSARLGWASNDMKIVGVNNGEVTAAAEGETTVAVTVGELKSAIKVTVALPVLSSVGADKLVQLRVGEAEKLKAQALDAEGKSIVDAAFTFKAADEKIAKVSADGTIKALKVGKTRVTITTGDKTAEVQVVVKKK